MTAKRSNKINTGKLRKQAERIVGDGQRDVSGMSLDDIASLVQELEAHQVELELQNEELLRIQEELRESRDRYLDLFDYAPSAYFTLNRRSNTIIEVNLTACTILGTERANLLKTRFTQYIEPEFTDAFYFCRKKAAESLERQSCEIRMRRGDGPSLWTELQITSPPENHQLRITALDITRRKEAEQALAQQSEIMQRIFDRVPVLLVMWDPRLQKFTLNRYAEEVLGWTTEDANRGDFMSKVYPDPEYREQVAGYMQSLEPGWLEWNTTARDGTQIPIEWANTWLSNETMIGIGVDLRERKKKEEDLLVKDYAIASATAGVALADLDGKLAYVNQALLTMWGYEKEGEVLGKPTHQFVTDESKAKEAFNKTSEQGSWDGELQGIRKDGSIFDVYVSSNLVRDTKGKPIHTMASFLDITERKKAEETLRQNEERERARAEEMEALMDVAPAAIWISHDPQCKVIVGNDTANRFYEAHEDENVSAGPASGGFQDFTRRFFKGERELKPEELPMQMAAREGIEIRDDELEVLTPSGRRIAIMGSAKPLFDPDGKVRGCVATFMNITQRKEGEEELEKHRQRLEEMVQKRTSQLVQQLKRSNEAEQKVRSLSQRLLEIQEKERREIGHALHDEVGGTLTMLKLALKQARKKHGEETIPEWEEVEQVVDELADQIRYISHSLRPSMLDDHGLLEALQWYLERYEERTGIKVNFSHSMLDGRFPEQVETTAYRIVQEALTNAAKYSDAKSIDIELLKQDKSLAMSISDTGCGFDPSEISLGTGLRGMEGLCELIGGSMTIDSSPREGTFISCELPIELQGI